MTIDDDDDDDDVDDDNGDLLFVITFYFNTKQYEDMLCRCIAIALCHWTGNNILFRYIVFYIVFCKLFRPAFWHAFNKRILID